MDGFGEKSYQNLIDSIERAKNTTLPRLIFGLGILNIGLANARMICKAFDFDLDGSGMHRRRISRRSTVSEK